MSAYFDPLGNFHHTQFRTALKGEILDFLHAVRDKNLFQFFATVKNKSRNDLQGGRETNFRKVSTISENAGPHFRQGVRQIRRLQFPTAAESMRPDVFRAFQKMEFLQTAKLKSFIFDGF